uniref:Uncharacterized protein LOC111116015 n=1 Tax=Crassostrea virginica TaxID=6565 RepID=A0A8B8C515_CRAVI|nr:uncharacterized protein LOC111116015 [Crassostrea virginica]
MTTTPESSTPSAESTPKRPDPTLTKRVTATESTTTMEPATSCCLSTSNNVSPDTSVDSLVYIVIGPVLGFLIILIIIVTVKIYMHQKLNKKKDIYSRESSGEPTDKPWTYGFNNHDTIELPRAQLNTTKSSSSSECQRYHYA